MTLHPPRNPLDCRHRGLTDIGNGSTSKRLACWACGTPFHLIVDETDEPTLFTGDPT